MAELMIPQEAKKSWEAPAIVLERPIMVTAQEGTTDSAVRRPGRLRDNGLLSPLGTSGGNCQ